MSSCVISDSKVFENQIKGKKIYIYGNGVFGRTLLLFIEGHSTSAVQGFVVSKKDMDEGLILKPVFSIDEYATFADDDCRLIIGVSKRYEEEIIKNVARCGVNDVLLLSDEYWNYIMEKTSFHDVKPIKNIAIMMYHRIDDNTDDLWRLNVSRKTFERQISYISDNYDVLRLEEDWENKVDPSKKYVIITFDDGYVDNYIDALPILEKYRVPATFFIPTDLIGSEDMFWWDELEELLIKDNFSGIILLDDKEYLVEKAEDRESVCKKIRNRLKNMQPDEIKEKMDEIRNILHQRKRYSEKYRCMSTDELGKLSDSEYASIGVHTKSHISMGENMPYEIMMEEVQGSLRILENITKKKITTFAYPFGGKDDYCELAEKVLRENGIKKAAIVKSENIGEYYNQYMLPRHMIIEDDDIENMFNRIWTLYG